MSAQPPDRPGAERPSREGRPGQGDPGAAAAAAQTGAAVTLRDLLGALASDAVAARAQADAEAVRIALMYRGDPLLRTLPAPLFRLADLTITMPLVITSVPDAAGSAPLPLHAAAATAQTLTLDAIANQGGDVSGRQAADLARGIEVERERLEHDLQAASDPLATADRLMLAALNALPSTYRALLEAEGGESPLDRELLARARAQIATLAPTAGVGVAATTAAIESVGSRESLMQLRVNLSERGMEWALGEEHERLVPE
jgi:hypothetical protein